MSIAAAWARACKTAAQQEPGHAHGSSTRLAQQQLSRIQETGGSRRSKGVGGQLSTGAGCKRGIATGLL
jgi:hypothetical protein